MRAYTIAFVTAFLGLVAAASATEAPASNRETLETVSNQVWLIAKLSGTAWVESPNHEPMLVSEERKLFPGQTLVTAARTRLMLQRGEERMQLGSNTSISLLDYSDLSEGKTVVKQQRGTLHLSVQKKNVKHFSVQTPYMVAAVKGTNFTVSVDDKLADVRVHEGVVEVTSLVTDEKADLSAGQAAVFDVAAIRPMLVNENLGFERDALSGANIAQTGMLILERGEEAPELLAARAAENAKREARANAGLLSKLAYLLNDLVVAGVGIAGGAVSASVLFISGAVSTLLSSALGVAPSASSVQYWVMLVLAAIAVGVIVFCAIAYMSIRRRRA